MLAVVTGGFLLWRYGRRKLRAFRSHGAVVGATALWDMAASNRWNRSGAAVTPAEVATVVVRPGRARRCGAPSTGPPPPSGPPTTSAAPTAELPSLVPPPPGGRRRHRPGAAGRPGGAGARRGGRQVLEVVRAADDVQQAAVASAGEASAQRVRELTEDAGHELTLLDAGLASMRTRAVPNCRTDPQATGSHGAGSGRRPTGALSSAVMASARTPSPSSSSSGVDDQRG